jgi:hypothetical protein
MASPASRYQTEMFQNLQLYATWLPGDLLDLGDVGTLKNGAFSQQTTLAELQIPFTVSPPGPAQNLQYSSKSGTNIKIDTSAAPPPPFSASASVQVDFSEQGAFVFQASNVVNQVIQNQLTLAAAILDAYKSAAGARNGSW